MYFKRLLAAVASCLAIAGAVPAGAAPIVANQWYTFGFLGTGTALISGAGGFTIGLLSIAAPDPAWTINLAGAGELVVVDGFQAGDEFELFDFGASIGSTSAVATDGTLQCSNNEIACMTDGNHSVGTFLLAAGNHSFTGTVTDSPFGGGAGFFIVRLRTVPEPGMLLLLVAGFGALGIARMRRLH